MDAFFEEEDIWTNVVVGADAKGTPDATPKAKAKADCGQAKAAPKANAKAKATPKAKGRATPLKKRNASSPASSKKRQKIADKVEETKASPGSPIGLVLVGLNCLADAMLTNCSTEVWMSNCSTDNC